MSNFEKINVNTLSDNLFVFQMDKLDHFFARIFRYKHATCFPHDLIIAYMYLGLFRSVPRHRTSIVKCYSYKCK